MIATVLDTVTGQRVVKEGIRSFEWAFNNWSCDCNRMTLFGIDDDSGVCVGSERFLVIDAQFDQDERDFSIMDLNTFYPEDLLREHLKQECEDVRQSGVEKMSGKEINNKMKTALCLIDQLDMAIRCLLGPALRSDTMDLKIDKINEAERTSAKARAFLAANGYREERDGTIWETPITADLLRCLTTSFMRRSVEARYVAGWIIDNIALIQPFAIENIVAPWFHNLIRSDQARAELPWYLGGGEGDDLTILDQSLRTRVEKFLNEDWPEMKREIGSIDQDEEEVD